MSNKVCKHTYYYYPETNEAGWRCSDCDNKPGEPPGYSPQLDRELLSIKVDGLLHDLCDANLIHVSNGSGADWLTAQITRRCETEGTFDQYSILRYILESEQPEHAEYWGNVGNGVMMGNDPRDRCACGALANVYADKKNYCSPCWRKTIESVEDDEVATLPF